MNDISSKLKIRLQKHSYAILNVFVIGLWVTSIIMFLIMCLGIFKISVGIILEFNLLHPFTSNDNAGIIIILQGLELIFLSPLFYLLVLSLTKYISATKPEINLESLEVKRYHMDHAVVEIVNVKILSVSLFISILILHALSLILEDKMTTHLIIYIITLLIFLVSYYLFLDIIIEKLKNQNK